MSRCKMGEAMAELISTAGVFAFGFALGWALRGSARDLK